MNRRTEILIGTIIILCVLVFFGLKIMDVSFDKDGVLEKIDEAIEKGDIDYLKDHVEVRGMDRDLTQQEVRNIADQLKDESVYSFSEYKDSPDANIYLKKKGREKIFLDKYTIVFKPYDLTIRENMKATKVFIDDEEVGEFKEDEEFIYEGLLPGKHTIKLKYKGDYANIEAKEDIVALSLDSDNEIYLDLELEGRYINVESNLPEATLYIDGKDTEINIYEEYRFGPIDEKKKMKISAKAKIDGKDYTSEIVEVGSSTNNYFSLYIDYEEPMGKQELLEKVDSLIDGYETGLVNAINYNSYSYLENYIEYGSPFMKAQKKLIVHLNEKGTSEDLLYYNIENITDVSQSVFYVTVSESHMLYYASGDKKEVNHKWKYTVVNINDQLFIRDIKAVK